MYFNTPACGYGGSLWGKKEKLGGKTVDRKQDRAYLRKGPSQRGFKVLGQAQIGGHILKKIHPKEK